MSLLLDLAIVLETFKVMLLGRGHAEVAATHAAPAVTLPARAIPADLAAQRSRLELRPGLWLALAFACGLAAARFIDVSEDGKAMLLFGRASSSRSRRPPSSVPDGTCARGGVPCRSAGSTRCPSAASAGRT